MEKHLAVKKELDAKDHTDRKHEKLDLPEHAPCRRAEGQFQIHQDDNGSQEKKHVDHETGGADGHEPTRAREWGVGHEERWPPSDHDGGRYDERGCDAEAPAAPQLGRIRAREGQTEQNPESGNEGLSEKSVSMELEGVDFGEGLDRERTHDFARREREHAESKGDVSSAATFSPQHGEAKHDRDRGG